MAKRNQLGGKMPAIIARIGVPVSAVLLFFVVALSSVSTVRGTAVFCVVLAFAGGVLGFKRLCERFALPMAAWGLFLLMGGISTFYAVSGKFALLEFLKLLLSFCLAVFMLAVVPGKNADPGRRIASVLEGFTALAGLVSIDLISTRVLSGAVMGVLGVFSKDYPKSITGLEVGTRITSIFQNPNAFASMIGLGVLLSLGLVLSSENKRERLAHLVCLYVNALSFLLAFSMGAVAFIAAAFLVYLLIELPERRAHLFVLMVETLILTVASVALVSMTSFTKWDGIRLVPLLCAVAGSVALCLVDRFAGQAVGAKLAARGKAVLAVIGVFAAALAVLALLAYNITGGIDLSAGENVRRAAYLEAGEYTLIAESEGAVKVVIKSQNQHETMMHTETQLYSGALSKAEFTVPEDSEVVYFTFSSKEGAYLESVECSGPENAAIPLGYKLLPSFIANRLQGLFANENAIQRTVFFEDGLKIFMRSPVFGLGLGSYENGIKSVQSFYYETKYAHNHYIQTMAETGLVGLVLFLLALGTSAAAVWFDRRKKSDCHALTPMLGAALVFMAGHALMEVSFSFYAYLPVATGVIALIALCCGKAISVPKLEDAKMLRLQSGAVMVCAVLVAVYAYFLIGNMNAARLIDNSPTMNNLVRAEEMDKFEYADHMLSYVVSAANFPDDEAVQAQAKRYAEELSQLNSNTVPYYLASYYFSRGETGKAMEMLEKYLRYVASDNEAWGKAFSILKANLSDSDAYVAGVKRIVDFMNEWNDSNLGKITLSENDELFLSIFGL